MNPPFGYPEGWQLPFEKKVIILDKTKFGGHSYLRSNKTGLIKTIKIFSKAYEIIILNQTQTLFHIAHRKQVL